MNIKLVSMKANKNHSIDGETITLKEVEFKFNIDGSIERYINDVPIDIVENGGIESSQLGNVFNNVDAIIKQIQKVKNYVLRTDENNKSLQVSMRSVLRVKIKGIEYLPVIAIDCFYS